MTLVDAAEVGGVIVASVGSGAAIVFGMSSWLGKVWAHRLMERERQDHAKELEDIRAQHSRSLSVELEHLKKALETGAQTHLREVNDKLGIYRLVVDIVANVLAEFDAASKQRVSAIELQQRLAPLNIQRMKAYGYMAMLAPQQVMDAFDQLADHLILVASAKQPYDYPVIRNLSLALLNEVRKDIGLDKSPIQYKGML